MNILRDYLPLDRLLRTLHEHCAYMLFYWSRHRQSELTMSSSAELYLLPRDKFEEYCTMSRLMPLTDAPPKMTMGHIILKGRKEIDEFIKRQKLYNAAGKFLKKHSEQPYEYRWSGYVFNDLLMFLRSKRINLMKNTLVDTRSGNHWYVVDSHMKERHLDKLDHRNFREEDLKHYHQLHERKMLTQASKLVHTNEQP
jgi:hypothetical protein